VIIRAASRPWRREPLAGEGSESATPSRARSFGEAEIQEVPEEADRGRLGQAHPCSPRIQAAIRYLNVTSNGRRWIDGLYSNVFRAERELRLAGPQS
jgi:hypothetical protein